MTNYKDVRYARSGASVTTIPTSAFSSGTFADARIAASNVTQHVTAFDDAKLKSDVQVLALNQANNENKEAYNLPNSLVEEFVDSTGIDTSSSYFWKIHIYAICRYWIGFLVRHGENCSWSNSFY